MTEIAELEARARDANRALGDAKEKLTNKRNSVLVGKYFKFQNNYSVPEKPSDYWWVYYRVLAVDGAEITVHSFETDKHGRMKVSFKDSLFWWHGPSDGYEKSTAAEFNKAWRALQKKIASGVIG